MDVGVWKADVGMPDMEGLNAGNKNGSKSIGQEALKLRPAMTSILKAF